MAQALDIQQNLLQDTFVTAETDQVEIERKEEEQVQENINYSFIKIINLSSILFIIVPPLVLHYLGEEGKKIVVIENK